MAFFDFFTRKTGNAIRAAVMIAACGFAIAAHADAAPAQLNVRSMAAMCAGCHGTDGKSAEGSSLPSLAGMPKNAMVTHMKAFKDGSRPATIMHQLARGFTDAQIEQIAGYFASVR